MSDCSTEAFKPNARMTKSKSQLRAEAVERLRKLDCMDVDCYQLLEAAVDDAGEKVGYRVEIRKLIDLLTDEELPEGDVVAILRETETQDFLPFATLYTKLDMVNDNSLECTEDASLREACKRIADMVERDYVRRDSLTDDEPETITRDSIEEIMRNMAAEVTNGGVEIHGAIPIEDSLKSAMQRVDDLIDDDEPVNCKNDESLQDSREKLEEDVRKFSQVYYTSHLLVYDKVIELLDRQAAITERECADEYVNTWTEGSVAWILRQYEDEKLMRDVDCEAKIALETEELQDKVDALEEENAELRAKLDAMGKAAK